MMEKRNPWCPQVINSKKDEHRKAALVNDVHVLVSNKALPTEQSKQAIRGSTAYS